MKEYHKINSIFKRDLKGKFILNDWADPAFEFLQNNLWVFTEKVDGTNVRIHWDTQKVTIGGRTDAAQMPLFLVSRLQELFTPEKFAEFTCPVTLYGEGYGAKIQKGGGNYIPDGVDFTLFDILISEWWLQREDIGGIGAKMGLKVVPIIGEGTIADAMKRCQDGFHSQWGAFTAEGIVLRPKTELKTRRGDRIITKIKNRDFKEPPWTFYGMRSSRRNREGSRFGGGAW